MAKTEKYRFVLSPNWTGQIKWKGENAKTVHLNDTIEVTEADKKNKTLADTLAKYFVLVEVFESEGIKIIEEKDVKKKMKEKKYGND